jgi:hypothetical protein
MLLVIETAGKIEVLLLRGFWRTFPTRASILKLASRNVQRRIMAQDEERKKKEKKRIIDRN